VAQQPGQIGYSIIDAKAVGRFMPPVFDGEKANTIAELAQKMGLSVEALTTTVNAYNAACAPKNFDHSILDGNTTTGITPVKSNWALPIDTPPFYGYALRPGITFTYLGVQITEEMQVKFNGAASDNIFAAGEIMAGNILGKGYLAGIGMTIGTSSGRIAGRKAAHAATR
jgi:tricarballylate dehydrogenase